MPEYHLSIITPNGKIFDDQIEALTAPGTEGGLGVLARHTPLITSLRAGILKLTQKGSEIFYAINSGVLEVNDKSEVLVLADKVIEAANLEAARQSAKELQSHQK